MYPRLQFLTLDAAPLSHHAQALAALQGGARWIQLRAKGLPESEWTELARSVVELCRDFDATCIINDSPRVALLSGAHGVHLGAEDMSPADARALLGEHAIIGATLNSLADISRIEGVVLNYVGLGPYRTTTSKQKLAPVHSPESLRSLIAALPGLPAYVIGGVTTADVAAIRQWGAHGIAVSGAIALAADPSAATSALLKATSA
ncbi:MAG: thiamine phosphate synthase [Verrucomicrobia bacterium]|nr:thiamine phosphate synthase [Verrucomicrobiota bacterium]